MTELDKWEPKGTPIHPFDLYDGLVNGPVVNVETIETHPTPVDEADYHRNISKIGTVVVANGQLYFETSTIEPVTKTFS